MTFEACHILREDGSAYCGATPPVMLHGGANAPDACAECVRLAVEAGDTPPKCQRCGQHHDQSESVLRYFHGETEGGEP